MREIIWQGAQPLTPERLAKKTGNEIYPWRFMEVGDKFIIQFDTEMEARAQTHSIRQLAYQHWVRKGLRYSVSYSGTSISVVRKS